MSSSNNDNSQISSTNSDNCRPSTSAVHPTNSSSTTSLVNVNSHNIKNSSNNIVGSQSDSLQSEAADEITNSDVNEEDSVFLGRNDEINTRETQASADIAAPEGVNIAENYTLCPIHTPVRISSLSTPNTIQVQNQRTQSECSPSNNQVTITPPPLPPRVVQGPPPLSGAPPSYSAVMRLGPMEPETYRGRPVRMQPSPPFVAPVPPPPYTEYRNQHIDRSLFAASVDQMVWGPDPLSVVCPRCANVVMTTTQSQRSNLTHFSALALCLCGCWPCCLLPYCMDSCKNTYHHCPSCQQFLGIYRPW